jgi:subtilase family serine protease
MRLTLSKFTALLLAAVVAAIGASASGNAVAADANVATADGLAAIPGSLAASTSADIGEFSSSNMTIEVVLAPSNEPQLNELLTSLYDSTGANYQQWLGTGEFNSRFAPSDAQIAAVQNHLQSYGLNIQATSSPFLVRASGPSAAVAAAFGTSIHNYRNDKGTTYFSNASEVRLPASVVAVVRGIVGLSNTVRLHTHIVRPARHFSAPPPSCEAPYPTAAQQFNFENNGVSFPAGYGGGPGCNGLTPAQTNSIYGAPDFGPSAQGAGVKLAVFELSAYQRSDIETWAHQFYGRGYTPPLVDITVDGGPLNPICPAGDTCPPDFNGYSGDIEVDADIETQLAVSPAAQHILVYNAPNDFTGQTELDEYAQIASDNRADVISSSWGECENDAGAGYVQAEDLIFKQMALQGQSMFGAAGDTGAFDCIRSDGTTIVNVDDPPSQPWVTSVGGTSFESFNPNANPNPNYPYGIETVWNTDDLCNTSASEGGTPGTTWCALTGAGGGGNSQFWGRPSYQQGPGITNSKTAYGNGTTNCSLAAKGTPCREVPDISANADEYTPYAEYCTGSASTAFSTCATFSGGQTPPGWFGIGGTSLSSPLWSAIIANRVGFRNHRVGNANPLLYLMYNVGRQQYFNDITGEGQRTNNNGLFPTTPGYDLATGIGTPKMAPLITGFP